MKKTRRIVPALLAALLMMQPLHAAAMEEVILPGCETQLFYTSGALEVHFDRNYNGATIAVYRIQEEGVFLYYSYDVRLIDEAMMHCDLIEGDYEMEVTMPSADGTDVISFPPFAFTMKDPDMDETQSFDKMEMQYHLTSDSTLTEDVLKTSEATMEKRMEGTKEERWICQKVEFTAARRDFRTGDLNGDGEVNASDAALTLIAAALVGAGSDSGLTAMQSVEADVTGDSLVNASDAALILVYAADHSAGNFPGEMLDYARIKAGK
ncbi:MAG: dockerin type I repeat-containing protein [Oscillospiraceae bacterium]|nr:dockerin type I repeat-containing protein [Oscillospiraceae bacterium]